MRPGCKGYPREVRSRVISDVLNGKSYHQAAADNGVDRETVRRWCKAAGISGLVRTRRQPPENEPQAEIGISRRAYLLKILREALPEAVRAAREKYRNHIP